MPHKKEGKYEGTRIEYCTIEQDRENHETLGEVCRQKQQRRNSPKCQTETSETCNRYRAAGSVLFRLNMQGTSVRESVGYASCPGLESYAGVGDCTDAEEGAMGACRPACACSSSMMPDCARAEPGPVDGGGMLMGGGG